MAVTVIIPNYNNAAFICECLQSVLTDDAVSEIIVYDNASSDSSVDIIEQLAEPKITLIRGDYNIGASRARHAAIMRCTSEFICFLDGDDYLAPGTVSACYRAAADRSLDVAVPQMIRFSAETGETIPYVARPPDLIDGRTAFMMTIGAWRIHPMGVLRRDSYLKASKRFEFAGFTDDELLTRHLFLVADRVGGSEGTYFYRWVGKPWTRSNTIAQLTTELQVLKLAQQLDEHAIRAVVQRRRNQMVTSMLKLLVRSRLCGQELEVLRSLAVSIEAIGAPWKFRDLPYKITMQLVAGFCRNSTAS